MELGPDRAGDLTDPGSWEPRGAGPSFHLPLPAAQPPGPFCSRSGPVEPWGATEKVPKGRIRDRKSIDAKPLYGWSTIVANISSTISMVVCGCRNAMRATVSPSHFDGVTNPTWSASSRADQVW